MQCRPLHMVLLRGALPQFQGHCVDGAKTRVTITSDTDSAGRTVWQVGGQIAEVGVSLDKLALLSKTRAELLAVLPGIDLAAVEWNTYQVDRAEGRMSGGQRPETVQIRCEGNCLTAWPTKLALVPQLVSEILEQIQISQQPAVRPDWKSGLRETLREWPRPQVALPPWETATNWLMDSELSGRSRALSRAA